MGHKYIARDQAPQHVCMHNIVGHVMWLLHDSSMAQHNAKQEIVQASRRCLQQFVMWEAATDCDDLQVIWGGQVSMAASTIISLHTQVQTMQPLMAREMLKLECRETICEI